MLKRFSTLFMPPTFEDDKKTRAAQYLNAIIISSFTALAFFLLTGAFFSIVNLVFSIISVSFIGIWFLLRSGHVTLSSTLFIFITWVGMTYLAWMGEGVRDVALVLYIILIFLASLLGNTQISVSLTILSIIATWSLYYGETTNILIPKIEPLLTITLSMSAVFVLAQVIIYFTVSDLEKILQVMKKNEEQLLARNKDLLALQDNLQKHASELEVISNESKAQAARLETITEVSQAIALTQNLEDLLSEITIRIAQGFHFYHVGLFTIDGDGRFIRLRAANSTGGKKMLERGYQVAKDENKIVALVARDGKSRVALNSEEASVYFTNPDLQESRSKIALPLKVAENIIGVLDIQSIRESSFSPEETEAFESLANQVAIAIENASQTDITQAALKEAQAVSRQYIHQEWAMLEATKEGKGYRYAGKSLSPIKEGEQIYIEDRKGFLSVPVRIHEKTVGYIQIHRDEEKKNLNTEEQELVEAIVERAALALENARLLENSQRLVAKEQAIGEISEKLNETTEIEALMKVAVSELRDVLGASEVTLEIEKNAQAQEGE